jgi:hypothetical protein
MRGRRVHFPGLLVRADVFGKDRKSLPRLPGRLGPATGQLQGGGLLRRQLDGLKGDRRRRGARAEGAELLWHRDRQGLGIGRASVYRVLEAGE